MHVVVTGAAGLIGGEVVRRLADAGHAVTALVHRTHHIVANDGRVVASRPWDGPPGPGAVATLVGDVRAAGLGLAVDPCADLIVHAAAITAFDASPEVYRAVNIDGTAHVIALAERRGTPLLMVSTAYVCGTRDGIIHEGEHGTAFANGYEASKAAAEILVEAAAARGLPAVVARPSIVVGDSRDGALRAFGNIYAVFRLIAEGRLRTLPGAAGADARPRADRPCRARHRRAGAGLRARARADGPSRRGIGDPARGARRGHRVGAGAGPPGLRAARSIRRRRAGPGGAALARCCCGALHRLSGARAAFRYDQRRPAGAALPADRCGVVASAGRGVRRAGLRYRTSG